MKTITLLLLCFCFASAWLAVACGADEQSSIGAEKDAESTLSLKAKDEGHGLIPDSMVILVRDVEGYFEDCGCSGAALGGLARLPSIYPSVDDTTYLFFGNTFKPSTIKSPQARDQVSAGLKDNFRQISESLGNVFVVDGDLNAESLASSATGLLSIAKLEGLKLLLASLEANEFKGMTQTRGRGVLVLAFWHGSGHGPPNVSKGRRLSAILPMALRRLESNKDNDGFVSSSMEELATLKTELRAVYAWWPVAVSTDFKEDPRVAASISRGQISSEHQSTGSKWVEDEGRSQAASRISSQCSGCHEKAVAAWLTHRHSDSMRTLRRKSRQSDLRCVTCHAEAWDAWRQSAAVRPFADAVTCQTCHDRLELGPSLACQSCHTSESDSRYKEKKPNADVCAGAGDAPFGECKRDHPHNQEKR